MPRASQAASPQRARATLAIAMARAVLVLVAGCSRAGEAPTPEGKLELVRDGKVVASLPTSELVKVAKSEEVRGFDPYYGREKRFRAVPMGPLLARAFPGVDVAARAVVFHAADGYEVPIRGATLLEGAYLAYADADAPKGTWEPIGSRRASPAPYYLVWAKDERLDAHPRPWQVTRVEIVTAPRTSHLAPEGLPPSDRAWRGLDLFRGDCIHCHAMNREGGSVGPELNVPRSIVEYRPEGQIKAYVKNPQAFRYTIMPPHPNLTDDDLDALVAYFRAMSSRKYDPDASRTPSPTSDAAAASADSAR